MKKNIIVLMIITLITKTIGFGKQMILAYLFGASSISDAYLISITIPTVIFGFIGTTIIAGFIPKYNLIKETKSEVDADEFTSNLTNVLFVIISLLVLFVYLFSDRLVMLFASGFDDSTMQIASTFTRISVFSLYSIYISSIFTAYIQIKNDVTVPALLGIPTNILLIFFIIWGSKINILLLPIGFFLSMTIKGLSIFIYARFKNYKHRFTINIKDKNIQSLVYLAGPMIVGISVNQINILVDRTVASQVAIGGISALNYASSLNSLIQGIFVMSIITSIYPILSLKATNNDIDGLRIVITKSFNLITLLVIPASLGMLIFSKEIVQLLFSRGSFDQSALLMTSSALSYYSIGMLSIGIRDILSRLYYAMNDIKTPMKNAIYGLTLNIILNFLLSRYLGVGGIALATSISATVTSLLLLKNIRLKIGNFGTKKLLHSNIKILFASALMIVISKMSFNYINTLLSQNIALIIAIAIGIAIYFSLVYILKVEYVDSIKSMFRKNN